MSNKTTKILLAVFLLLFVLVIAPSAYEKYKSKTSAPGFVSNDSWIESLNTAELTKIILEDTQGNIELTRTNDNWQVNGKRADGMEVASFITKIKETKKGDLISRNKDNHSDLGVTNEAGTKLTLSSPKQETTLLVGNSTLSGNSFYYRKADQDLVFIGLSDLQTFTNTEEVKWRDKKVFNLDQNLIGKVQISGYNTFSLDKDTNSKIWSKNLWGNITPFDSETSGKIDTAFSPLTGFGFASQQETADFNTSWDKYTVVISDTQGVELTRFETRKSGEDYIVKASNSEDLFKLYKSKLDFILE
ncbi:hypothetical protein A3K34_03825 [candidate division WWE3 bacterium RIFOXYC1_FULL_40_10]|uniref:DUF4340 domain-containing protein n=1 Tax=candidate division WWE3 bacterium RIFOXYA2_FULL_46_9 TaxID=1802636 RepID=A0A1F4W0V3_UNCKA|nr:MAG: hypothetical protein A3K58_03825 [candidate division WWE3 bacterium RIFOXYB1_FULL_40_22]OGC61969.1 MAG: hypothetical protein A3K37_03825 [candidate division WWE3 bacterium RIFOXYA1_FULL_40_11]OGC63046.1 MAG: hypothetical protein A2264_03860 [candidate division WWE3 bacterium RIFOXYA2_FULL_46_9]OGC64527.1 MAG: hypothetical protein A2326_03965 [candidate division WWE3 bacterium RIFOXYB2_FULL_41_6]OGC66352.1 MAG: hypothetical protein A3K34_03825 [candidate division WWE3 bacterium RIFOXYC1_